MGSPTNSSQNGGIIGVSNAFTPSSCLSAKTTSFTSSGTFTAQATATADYLVIAGGGGGASSVNGGGGAGGYRSSVGPSPLQGSAIPVVAGVSVDVTIGAGGAGGGPGSPTGTHGGTPGANSIFAGSTPITSTGGGRAGYCAVARAAGGSGGGGGASNSRPKGGAGNAGSFPVSEGNNGGSGWSVYANFNYGGQG